VDAISATRRAGFGSLPPVVCPGSPAHAGGRHAPDGYPDSLALCIIDSIYSTGARYSSVVNVVGRYRDYRTGQGRQSRH